MNEQNLYKLTFSNENGVFVSLVVSVNPLLTENQSLLLIAREVASNYCEDNHFLYSEGFITEMLNGATIRLLGKFRPMDGIEGLDFDILSFNKTKYWHI